MAAVIGLERVMDAITAAGLAVSRSPDEPVPPDGIRRLSSALRAVSEAIRSLLGVLALASGSPCRADWRDWLSELVGLAGLEPATSCTQSTRASQAALQPVSGRV